MKKLFFLTLLLILFSVALPAFGQAQTTDDHWKSFVAVGPQLGTTTASGPFGSAETVAGGFAQGAIGFRLANLEFSGRGLMSLENGLRFFPQATDAAFNAAPSMRMFIPLGGSWDFLVDGGVDMQRAESATIINPIMTFGARHRSGNGGTQQFTASYLFDDMNDSAPPQFFRGYRGSAEILKPFSDRLGVLIGLDVDRQAQGLLLAAGPRTQAKLRIGLAFK